MHNITDNWIVANPFNRTDSNWMINNGTNYTESRIKGLIFISDNDITSQKTYEDPTLIARLSDESGKDYSKELLQSLSYNANSTTNYKVMFVHQFME